MTIEFANKSLASFILVMNIYFLYFTVDIIIDEGGPMGIGLLVLPFVLFINSFIMTAILALFKKFTNNKVVLIYNSIGTFIITLFIFLKNII